MAPTLFEPAPGLKVDRGAGGFVVPWHEAAGPGGADTSGVAPGEAEAEDATGFERLAWDRDGDRPSAALVGDFEGCCVFGFSFVAECAIARDVEHGSWCASLPKPHTDFIESWFGLFVMLWACTLDKR